MKKIIIKIVSALLFVILTAGFVSCNFDSGNEADSGSSGIPAPTDNKKTPPVPVKPVYIGTKTPEDAKTPGDILFKDGSATPCSENLTLTSDELGNVAGIVVLVNADGKSGLIAGIKYRKDIKFAKLTPAYTFDEIKTTFDTSTKTFSGDTDGSDNLAFIQAKDEKAVNDLENYYPALYYACKYGENNSLTGKYATGWYLPAQKELYDICQNIQIIEDARVAAGESRLEFIKSSYNPTPGSYNTNHVYHFLSSNISKSTTSTPSYDVNAIRINYDKTNDKYTCGPDLHAITKGYYSESSGGGSSGTSEICYYPYVMAVHPF